MSGLIRQQYHLEPDRGLLNDPNGLAWFKGKYYVFFQWNRFEKNHSYKEWGRFTSKDLLEWEFEGSAIIPDQEYECDGVYSGSGYVIGEQLYLFYTGNNKKGGKRTSSQCLAVTADGKRYQKKGIIVKTPEQYSEHFRDPKVFPGSHSDYYMVIGAQQKNGKGAVALCHSYDGEEWNYQSMLAVSNKYEMIECPDLFQLDGKYVLLFNPQKRNNITDESVYSFSAYKTGIFDEEQGVFQENDLDVDFQMIDAGFDFYAPQTFLSPDGRRILFAWMSRMEDAQEKVFSKTESNIHCLTLPRELSLRDGRLYQRPVRELYNLLGKDVNVVYEESKCQARTESRAFFLNIQQDKTKDFDILLYQGEIKISYNSYENEILFSRKNWIKGTMETKTSSVKECRKLEIWSDHSSIEVFVNEGEVVFSARIFPESKDAEIIIDNPTKDMEITIREIESAKKRKENIYE